MSSNNQDFKDAMRELNEINSWFQNNEIDLDEGLSNLKRAKELIKVCRGRLKEAENEFNLIKNEIVGSETIEEIGTDDSLPFATSPVTVTATTTVAPRDDDELPF